MLRKLCIDDFYKSSYLILKMKKKIFNYLFIKKLIVLIIAISK